MVDLDIKPNIGLQEDTLKVNALEYASHIFRIGCGLILIMPISILQGRNVLDLRILFVALAHIVAWVLPDVNPTKCFNKFYRNR